MADTKLVSLAAYRLRREMNAALDRDLARPAAPSGIQPTYLGAEAGKVLLAFSDGTEVDLSPEHAELWAERLAEMAKTARALAGEEGA